MAGLMDYARGNARIGIENIEPQFGQSLQGYFAANPGLAMYSGYRTPEHQRMLWEASDKTGRTVAAPGRSFHNYGEAADLTFNGVRLDRLPPEQQTALRESAGKFGLTFPMSYEPWHVQPIGATRPGLDQSAGVPSPAMANPPAIDTAPPPGMDLLGKLTGRQQPENTWLHDTSYSADSILSDMFAGRSPLKRYVYQQAANMFGNLLG